MRRRLAKLILVCVAALAVATWLRPGRGSRQIRAGAVAGKESVEPAPVTVIQSRGKWFLLVRLVSALTLVFAYLAVAVNAHWFPWQTNVPTLTLNLVSGEGSGASWSSDLADITEFLSQHHTELVHLDLTMMSETGGLYSSRIFANAAQFLYVGVKQAPFGTTDISMGSDCESFPNIGCTTLTLYVVAGPGANLGYDDGDTAATAFLDGYYQVGSIICQTGTCKIDVIPEGPPG
jgi:hypothetical protein